MNKSKLSKPPINPSVPINSTVEAIEFDVARQFKFLLFGKQPVTAQIFSDDKRLKPNAKVLHGTFKQLKSELAKCNRRGMDVGMCIQQTDQTGRAKGNIVGIVCIVLDDDERRDAPRSFPLDPWIIVESSPGRYHYYWRISGLSPAAYSKLAKRLAKKYGGDVAVAEPARAMRWPGFISHKRADRHVVRIVESHVKQEAWDAEEFAKNMSLIEGIALGVDNKATVTAAASDDDLEARVVEALKFVDANPYEVWLLMLMALHNLEQQGHAWAERAAQEFSQRSPKYDSAEFERKWASFQGERASKVAEGTIFYYARRGGQMRTGAPIYQPGEDLDNSELIVGSLEDAVLKYLTDSKQWIEFGASGWGICGESVPMQIAKEKASRLRKEAFGSTDRGRVAASSRLGSLAGLRAALELARMDPRVEGQFGAFNGDRQLLGVVNGVLDLKGKQLLAATPEILVTRRANVPYDAAAKCPAFGRFLRQVTCDDKEVFHYLQKLLGYVVYASCHLHVLPIFYGTGRNGKGTLIDTLQWLLGDYASQVQASVFMDRRFASGGPTPELAQLPGVRFLNVTEVEKTRRMDHALLKQISGQDTINCRGLYQAPFVFKPMFTTFLVSNHRIQLDSDDEALWERIHVVPFDAHFAAEQQDHGLRDALKSEGSGILNWLLRGNDRYLEEGLRPPERVIQATLRYRHATDSFMRWYEKRCARDANALAPAGKLYADYEVWCAESDVVADNDRRFMARLLGLGHKQVKKEKGHFYAGVRLNTV